MLNAISSSFGEDSSLPRGYVFIIGAMKSGTTSLYDILSQHPQVCTSVDKETGFFNRDLDEEEILKYKYSFIKNKKSNCIALEASVSYTQYPLYQGVPERIKRSGLANCKFIYIVRNPIKRIESHIRHGLFAGWGKGLEHGIPSDAIEYSRYAMQLDRFARVFSKENIYILQLEDFAENPCKYLKEICGFLALDEYEFSGVEEVRNSGDFFETARLLKLFSQNEFVQTRIIKFLPIRLKTKIRRFLSNTKIKNKEVNRTERWRLTDIEISEVQQELIEDIYKLRDKYGVNVSKHWGY